MKVMDWDKIDAHMNKPVICTFKDHATGQDLVVCKAIGFLGKNEEDHIVLVSWDCPELSLENRLSNMESVAIIKSAIIDIRPLGPKQKWG